MTPNITEPTSPTSSQPSNAIFIILGATLGSSACAVLITAMIILVICILQRRTPSTKWTHSNESKFKSSSTKAMHCSACMHAHCKNKLVVLTTEWLPWLHSVVKTTCLFCSELTIVSLYSALSYGIYLHS